MQSLRESTEVSLSFESILWETDSQEATSDAHICLDQKESLVFVSKGMKFAVCFIFVMSVTSAKISSSIYLY